jgi:hypothetical protein
MVTIPTFNPLTVTLVVWTVWRGWHSLPKAIQRHALIAVVINIPLYILFCNPGELRDFSLLYITFLLLVASNLTELASSKTGDATQLSS